jgi:hypothetical protein
MSSNQWRFQYITNCIDPDEIRRYPDLAWDYSYRDLPSESYISEATIQSIKKYEAETIDFLVKDPDINRYTLDEIFQRRLCFGDQATITSFLLLNRSLGFTLVNEILNFTTKTPNILSVSSIMSCIPMVMFWRFYRPYLELNGKEVARFGLSHNPGMTVWDLFVLDPALRHEYYDYRRRFIENPMTDIVILCRDA